MENRDTSSLRKAVQMKNALTKYHDEMYLNMLNHVNTKYQEILDDDLGSQFVSSCGRDLAGELVRNFFDTSDYHLTVDQLVSRIFTFDYENDYDPLKDSGQVHKLALNYNEVFPSKTLKAITADMDANQKKVFNKTNGKYDDHKMIEDEKKAHAKRQMEKTGVLRDDYTGEEGEYITDKNGNRKRRLQVEHTQSLAAATYNEKYIKEKGLDKIKLHYNSKDNFAMMLDTANQTKSDVRVCLRNKADGKTEVVYMDGNQLESEKKRISKIKQKDESSRESIQDITHRATPEQYAEAVVYKLENISKAETNEKLTEKGYLDEDGKVPKHIKNKLTQYIKHSQNMESVNILKNADYAAVGKDALGHAKKSIGKIIAGQVLYYGAPPIVYEAKEILRNKPSSLEQALDALSKAAKRVVKYVTSMLKPMFANITFNSLKNFVKIFMDILINLVKATVKKIMRLAKNLVMAVVDAVRIIARKDSSRAEKANAVCNLFAVTLTTFAVDALFDAIGAGLHIPDFLLVPLQILATVVCTNLTMLILQKVDLFDIRFGFKIQAIRRVFDETHEAFNTEMELAEKYTQREIDVLIEQAKEDCRSIHEALIEQSPFEADYREGLDKMNRMFDIGIDFDDKWLRFAGITAPPALN